MGHTVTAIAFEIAAGAEDECVAECAALVVRDLLARRAKCPTCGHLLTEVSERMHQAHDEWTDFVVAVHLCIELERQNALLRYTDADLEGICCLQDLVAATAALLIDVPTPTRRHSALEAVRSAFGTAFPDVPCPSLGDRLAGALRPHLHKANLFGRVATR